MLTKIEPMDIMTIAECRQKYADKWFRYVIVDKDEDWLYFTSHDIVRAMVMYTADSRDELLVVSCEELDATGFYSGGTDWGIKVNPEPGIQIRETEIEWLPRQDWL